MQTVIELVGGMRVEIENLLRELILKHSAITRWNYPDSGIIVVGGDYQWSGLDEAGRPIQSKTLEEYRRFSAIIRTLTQEQPQKYLKTLQDSENIITQSIEQNHSIYYKTTQEAFQVVVQALGAQNQVLANLYGESNTAPLFVPDTNALLFNPNLESWKFTDAQRFKIALTTTVLSELDQLKVNHRVEEVRKKTETLISRIKGYRARGRLTEGVPLVRDISEIISLAVEPSFSKSLPWLDPDNNDDRIIAAFVEVMRLNPRSPVILVTRDINLQNKAEFAHLPFCEPPQP